MLIIINQLENINYTYDGFEVKFKAVTQKNQINGCFKLDDI